MSPISNPIIELVLAERARQTEKWGVQSHQLPFWVLILQEEVGEVAKAFIEFKKPEEWDGQERRAEAYKDLITEAVQVTAVAVQMCEWMSKRSGWTNSAADVLHLVFARWKVSKGDVLGPYWNVIGCIGDLAVGLKYGTPIDEMSVSNSLRKIVFYGCELIYRLQQQEGGVDA